MGFGVWVLGFEMRGFWSGVYDLGLWGLGLRTLVVRSVVCEGWALGVRVWGLNLGVVLFLD